MKSLQILLGGGLVLASAVVNWAGPSADLMNSAFNARQETAAAAKVKDPGSKPSHHDWARCWSWSHTRNITAGQSTVAVPVVTWSKK